MNFTGTFHPKRGQRYLSIMLCFALIFSILSAAFVKPVEAKSTRVAVIVELEGNVTVQSSGGSREFDAYADMGLSQGDIITTGDSSSVLIKIKDSEDELTFGENSTVSLSELTSKGAGKKSRIKMWAGSLWSNIKKLAGDDDFEVETPTAVMAVRGTKVLTSVNNKTGETYVAVAAGAVAAKKTNESNNGNTGNGNNDQKKEVLIAPSQQITLDSHDVPRNLETKVAIIDPKKLVEQTSSKIIEKIVKDKAAIDQENAEFIAKQKEKIEKNENTDISRGGVDSSLLIKDINALDKVSKNLENLVGNVVKTAIENNKVNKEEINKVIEDTNKKIEDPTKKIDIEKVVPIDKSAGVDEELQKKKDEQLKKLEELKKQQEEEQKNKEEEQKQKLSEILKKVEEENKRIEKEKMESGRHTPGPTQSPTPGPTPGPAQEPASQPTTDSTSNPLPSPASPTPKPSPTVTVNPKHDTGKKHFDLEFVANDFVAPSDVYGVEVHVVLDPDSSDGLGFQFDATTSPSQQVAASSDIFGSNNSVVRFEPMPNTYHKDFIFAAVPTTTPNVSANGQRLAYLPLEFISPSSTSIQFYVFITVVDMNGNVTYSNAANPQLITLNDIPVVK